MAETDLKVFVVAAVSTNTNSFGLYGHVLIARDGTAYQAGANYINKKARGQRLVIDLVGPNTIDEARDPYGRTFAHHGFEIPERLADAPPEVVRDVWAATNQA